MLAKLPSRYILAASINEFKSKIKFWKRENHLCKKYQPNLGYINLLT